MGNDSLIGLGNLTLIYNNGWRFLNFISSEFLMIYPNKGNLHFLYVANVSDLGVRFGVIFFFCGTKNQNVMLF